MYRFALPLAVLLTPLLMQDPKPAPKPQEPVAQARVAPEVGKPAPGFRLNDHTGAAVAVGGAADHWTVVAFYPKAATPG